jgi:molybdopterin synthase catalytic subunit
VDGVVQVALEMPTDIALKLASGVYELYGGVVRDAATKRVVTWLKSADPSEIHEAANAAKAAAAKANGSQIKEIAAHAVGLVKENKKAAVAIVLVAAGSAAVAGGKYLWDKHKAKKADELITVHPAVLEFDAALRSYLDAAAKGTMTAKILDDLIEALDEIESDPKVADSVTISAKDFKSLLNATYKYTAAFSKANNISTKNLRKPKFTTQTNGFTELKSCLVIQREAFKNAA